MEATIVVFHETEEPDPRVAQTIEDFRSTALQIRDLTERASKLPENDRRRTALEMEKGELFARVKARCDRLGDGWTAEAMLLAISDDIHRRAGRVAKPSRESARTYLDRVNAATLREQELMSQHAEIGRQVKIAHDERIAAERLLRAYGAKALIA
jgi:hypothetical protein